MQLDAGVGARSSFFCPCRLVRVVRLGVVVVVLPLFLFPFFLGVVWFGGVHSSAMGSALPRERSHVHSCAHDPRDPVSAISASPKKYKMREVVGSLH